MFVAGTQIFTDSGYKNIEDISGHDKVLTRNFIGNAEFIQPFAVKKSLYDGDVVKISSRHWSTSVTPDHIINYDQFSGNGSPKSRSVAASEFAPNSHKRLFRKFRYMFSDEHKRERVIIYSDFGQRRVYISNQDWYKLVGFVLTRGFIKTGQGRPMLLFFLEESRMADEVAVLGDILDRIGIYYHVQYSDKTRPKLVVSSKNTLVNVLVTRLGSKKRKDMYLPEKIVYSSSRELTRVLIETIIDTSIKTKERKDDKYLLSTTNKKLVDSLILFGTLGGYSVSITSHRPAGEKILSGVTKKDSYTIKISRPVDSYVIKKSKTEHYSGYVYKIDLFDGQIYVKNGSTPIWMSPK